MTLLGDRVAVVQVDIGTRHGLNFIVDTGASDEILDAALAKELAVVVTAPTMVPQPGGAVPVGRTTGVDAALGSAQLKSWPFVTAPLRPLEPFIGRSFDGILGRKFFDSFVVEFDYANRRLRLYDPATFAYGGPGAVLPLERPDRGLLIRVRLEGADGASAEGLLQLDTGSFEALGLEGPDVERLHLLAASAPRAPLFGLAIGGETSGYRARLKSVVFGPHRIEGPIASVTTSKNAGDSDVTFGVVGGEILRRFKVVVWASRHQVMFEPASAMREPSRADASGLILASPRPFTQVIVYAVLEGAPGAQAGLRAGDELIDVDGQATGAEGLENISRLFAIPDKRYMLKIRRGADQLAIQLTTRPVLK